MGTTSVKNIQHHIRSVQMFGMLPAVLILSTLSQVACMQNPPKEESAEYLAFKERKNYIKSFSIYADPELLKEAKKENTQAKVNLEQQRIRLVVDGLTALDSPATTGKEKFETPVGTFSIIDKMEKKESNLYGSFFKDGKKIFTGSEKEYEEKHDGEKLEYDTYKGAALDNWLRLTRDGVGIHKSKGIFRRPASHGCVRVPDKASKILFSKLFPGSTVEVIKDLETEAKEKAFRESPEGRRLAKKQKRKKELLAYKDKDLPPKERLRLLREYKKSEFYQGTE